MQRQSSRVVLFVDDEYLIAIELESILSAAGYLVLSAVNVSEARQLLRLREVDLAVLDFRMGEAALELARDIEASGVPILFCTGSLPDEVEAVFPAARVIGKPFETSMILENVAAALRS